jgi:DNA topoisomerase-3
LELAQALYERHKLISYPRTDSRHLSRDVAATLPRIVKAIGAPYRQHLAPGTGERPLGRRFVDDSKVTDHHAIIPTASSPVKAGMSAEERKIYDLVCRRLLAAWHEDQILAVTTVITTITNSNIVDSYRTSGTAVQQVGWKVLDVAVERKKKKAGEVGDEQASEQSIPATLSEGQLQDLVDIKAPKKKTRPPKRFTEATLLTAMETAGKTLDEKELSDAMKESGLGTPATRAAIIEVLLKREYIVRNGKSLEATDKGIRLIEAVHPEVKSPAMTGQWEAYLRRIQNGAGKLEPFLEGIEAYVQDVVGKVVAGPETKRTGAVPRQLRGEASASETIPQHRPSARDGQGLEELLHEAFGFPSFRPNQELVCRAAIEGKDVLLVMPTGSGKSLCYQLPGLARGGTTVVISPLIALMEDQVAKLKQRGFAVERIHSGRDRAASRQASLDYLHGNLQFLFIAPERLRVNGFPEMLARRKPSLIAIDEAHCISQWGHDFRPDYRMLGQYLPMLRPAPVIALTATATPIVQNDIAEQLGLEKPARFIQGFRRDNIAIEVVEVVPSHRASLSREVLRDPARRPAIAYAPTRKQAEALAAEISIDFPAAVYHAGLDTSHRERVQQDFLGGKVDVIVATIAFGMGIDKADVRTVIHTGLPGSLESYYQEIGRAGRDGLPSRAILMQSYADRYTHDFFFDRDYPDIAVLDSIYRVLAAEPQPKAAVQKRLKLDSDLFDKAIEKLWIHGGAALDYAENITRGGEQWRPMYQAQGQHRSAQIELMIRFVASQQCRMSSLVRHFGDIADGKKACGICDFCAPANSVAQQFRAPTADERAVFRTALKALRSGPTRSTGRLYGELYPHSDVTRDTFEQVLGAMAREGLVTFTDAVFEKDGKQIPYRTASLTREGVELEGDALDFVMKDAGRETSRSHRSRRTVARAKTRGYSETHHRPEPAQDEEEPLTGTGARIAEALRAWRLGEAKRRGVPAFRIFSDRVLRVMADERPASDTDLLAIPGVGAKMVQKYGAEIYRIVRGERA